MKTTKLRIGMNIRFKDSKKDKVYKIIGRDRIINNRFTVACDPFSEDDGGGYFMTMHYIHENELERA